MKRDMDLVRKILLHIEANQDGKINLDIPDYSRDEIYLHVQLMKEGGLVEASIVPNPDGREHRILACVVRKLTWEGHDFLDAARDDTLWEQAKKLYKEKAGGLVFDSLKECLLRLAKSSLANE